MAILETDAAQPLVNTNMCKKLKSGNRSVMGNKNSNGELKHKSKMRSLTYMWKLKLHGKRSLHWKLHMVSDGF